MLMLWSLHVDADSPVSTHSDSMNSCEYFPPQQVTNYTESHWCLHQCGIFRLLQLYLHDLSVAHCIAWNNLKVNDVLESNPSQLSLLSAGASGHYVGVCCNRHNHREELQQTNSGCRAAFNLLSISFRQEP